ncbi:MAG: ComEC/Rec2 family competence protein [Lachnospiraceae bacterium]
MKTRKYASFLSFLLTLIIFLSVGCTGGNQHNIETTPADSSTSTPTRPAEAGLEIHFLDVGQGLAIYAKCGDDTMIYDGGDSNYSSFVVSYLKEQDVETLNYVIASHYDADHINGLIGALHVFDTDTIIGPDYAPDTKIYQSLVSQTAALGKEINHPRVGDSFLLGNATITILAPDSTSDHSNNNSVAIKIEHGQNSFVFTGDAEWAAEAAMLESGLNLDCDVLVLGHHGSANSTTWDFLQKTNPGYAVISCGAGNSYGHPHADTIEKLENMDIEIFRTDQQGTIIAASDGKTIDWNQEPSQDYSAGSSSDKVAAPAAEPAAESSQPFAAHSVAEFYILNKKSKKVHVPSCKSTNQITPENYEKSYDSLEEILDYGYTRCGNCLK